MGKIIKKRIEYGGSSNSAENIKYDDTRNVKEAINEVKSDIAVTNSNLNVRYNSETDCLDVIIDGNIVPTNIKCYAQSTNWFLNGVVNEDFLGLPVFAKATNGTNNQGTYETDGYFSMSYSYAQSGETGIYSSKKVPIGVYKSITVKFIQTEYYTESSAYAFCIGLTDSHYPEPWTGYLQFKKQSTNMSSSLQEITLDLSNYNNTATELYLAFTGITKTKIYDITFNK